MARHEHKPDALYLDLTLVRNVDLFQKLVVAQLV
jgi:hypothetical protein